MPYNCKKEKFLKQLEPIALSHPGTQGRVHMAAGMVYRNRMIATGINSYKSHPMMLEYGKNEDAIFLHAEIDAIKNALRVIDESKLSKCDIYILRMKKAEDHKTWIRGIAKPCCGCASAIISFGLRNAFWSEDDNKMDSLELVA
jgi:tRNA(Arg) A34 adenosine deaminase TadA